MAVYKVIERFDDKNGHGGLYEVGEFYLHADRVEALSSSDNKSGRPFIKELTVAELKDELTQREIEFDVKAKKDELSALLSDVMQNG